jgi:hypothetical protein
MSSKEAALSDIVTLLHLTRAQGRPHLDAFTHAEPLIWQLSSICDDSRSSRRAPVVLARQYNIGNVESCLESSQCCNSAVLAVTAAMLLTGCC